MLKQIAICLIEFYQAQVRFFFPSCCRFTPSCSEYAKQAIKKHGFFYGCLKAVRRVSCCHPFSRKAGIDTLE